MDQLTDDYPKLIEAIESARYAHSDGMGAYSLLHGCTSAWGAESSQHMGSIHLHCFPTASHYLKAATDAIFGWRNFLNDIVWHYRHKSAT